MNTDWCHQESDNVLLVEGQNDCHVILALCEAYKVPETFGIYECGSDDKAVKRLNALISAPKPPAIIGLVVDADNPNLSGRWQSIVNKLKQYNYVFPAAPELVGTIIEPVSETPRLGFWLMPNNQNDGMLEDFCKEMINDNSLQIVEECLLIAEASNSTSYKPVHRSKAVVHTYLAWQDEPGKPLGQAITAQSLRPDTATAQSFVSWMMKLFRDQSI